MNPTPPPTLTPTPQAQTQPQTPQPQPLQPPARESGALDVAHACPHCGHPLAVITVLVPVEDPAYPEEPAGGLG